MGRIGDFPDEVPPLALARQRNKCGSCGEKITALGNAGRADHKYGEGAQAHHIRHVKAPYFGAGDLENCVILCSSCHYSVHEGGNYRYGTVMGTPADYPWYNGVYRK